MSPDFEQVLFCSPNPYVILDRSLVITWANAAYLRVTGRARDDIVGREMFEAFPSEGESRRQLQESFERVLRTGEVDEIAHISYDIPNAEGGYDTHVWSATHTPFSGKDGAVEHILQHTVQITGMKDTEEGQRDAAGVMRRAAAVQQRFRGAERELERFRAMLEQAPGFMAVLSGPDHRFVMANAAYRELIGQRELAGRTVAEAIPEVVDQGFLDILDEVYATERPYFGERELVRLKTKDGATLKPRFLEFIFQPFRGPDDTRGIFIQGYDVSEEIAAEEHQRVLINELNHRVKNTLAVVQGLAQQTFRAANGDVPVEAFTERLAALASAHNLLTERNWESADLATIVSRSLAATAGAPEHRYTLSGPEFTLAPQTAVALAMVVHELATNALKYGALSTPEGTIAMNWTVSPSANGQDFTFEWEERGGPPVVEPERQGFGSRLIRRGLGGSEDRTTIDYAATGLRCRIESVL